MGIGGPAKYFVVVKSEAELIEALKFAKGKRLNWHVVGEGSNVIAADRGFSGLVIQNRIQRFDLGGRGRAVVTVGAGNNLLTLINKLNRFGLGGMERLAGIPGTLGGAIYGCAGAYGQEIRDNLTRAWYFNGKSIKVLNNKQIKFGYRTSIFKKHKNWVILGAEFRLKRKDSHKLEMKSGEIIKLRALKYKPGLKCPGSFFKNIKLADLTAETRNKLIKLMPSNKIAHGKIPAGYLLEQIGAKGMRMGSIRAAKHHGNLIYNPNGGKAADVKKLAKRLKALVKNKFGITIEEEVQYL